MSRTGVWEKGSYARWLAECRGRLPFECCGVVAGTASRDTVRIDGFAFVRNASLNPCAAFAFDPDDWVRVAYDMQKNRRDIVGFFHSHPSGTPIPSLADVQGWDGSGTYWIVGFGDAREQAAVSAYIRGDGGQWLSLPWRVDPEAATGG